MVPSALVVSGRFSWLVSRMARTYYSCSIQRYEVCVMHLVIRQLSRQKEQRGGRGREIGGGERKDTREKEKE